MEVRDLINELKPEQIEEIFSACLGNMTLATTIDALFDQLDDSQIDELVGTLVDNIPMSRLNCLGIDNSNRE